ncbi:unnamed protein product [Chrysodeixis includens]|uniref:C-type lectin domain-containing protein n=1 Tax=Chrysodeixis includens TaxID=689277 RepID=A0A9P0FWS0_CHRIL|nr:unnamed protein product [Chrysodeixis includens]
MWKFDVLVFCSLLCYAAAPPPSETHHYRTDYEYNRRTNAFYKLHIDAMRYGRSGDVCRVEGAQLMVPSTDEDIVQLHGMFKNYPDLGEYAWVGNDGQDHESAEASPIIDWSMMDSSDMLQTTGCDVVTRKGEVETMPCYQRLPFICKVDAKDAPYDRHCDVYGKDYRYYQSVGSCYAIPKIPYSWPEAYAECAAQGAHLVVLNSQTEHVAIYNLTNTEPAVPGARAFYFFFAGYRAEVPVGNATVVFKTIFNQTLDEAGYNGWSENEPNNAQGREYCGSIFKNDGKLNDLECAHEFGFICEKEVH